MKHEEAKLRASLGVLGLGADADRDDVQRAYRRLAREHHPDRSEAADAATRFDAVTEAYRHALDRVPRSRPTPQASAPPPSRIRSIGPQLVAGPVRVEPWPSDGSSTGSSTGSGTGSSTGSSERPDGRPRKGRG